MRLQLFAYRGFRCCCCSLFQSSFYACIIHSLQLFHVNTPPSKPHRPLQNICTMYFHLVASFVLLSTVEDRPLFRHFASFYSCIDIHFVAKADWKGDWYTIFNSLSHRWLPPVLLTSTSVVLNLLFMSSHASSIQELENTTCHTTGSDIA